MAVFYVTGHKSLPEDRLFPMRGEDVINNSPFSSHRKSYPVTTLPRANTPQGIKQRVYVYKRRTRLCTKYRLLLMVLIFSLLVSFLMTSLFLWQLQLKCEKSSTSPHISENEQTSTKNCLSLPEPIDLPDLLKILANKIKKMEEFITDNMNKEFGSLTANLFYRDNIIWTGTFGMMDKSKKPPRKPKTSSIYPCASISKLLTALLTYKLLDEKKIISLDDPVSKYDNDFKIVNPFDSHEMTLRNLLEMSSGVPREAPCYPSKANNMCPYNHSTMIRRIQNSSLLVAPNTITQYSNFGYALLGNVLAKRFSGGNYAALVKKYVLDPLIMTNTMLSIDPSHLKEVPTAYENDGKPSKLYNWGWLNPAGGFFTTVQDLAKLGIQLMSDDNDSRYLSKYTTRQLFSVANVMTDGKTVTGTPWEMQLVNGIVHREKGGSVFGYEGNIAMVPELRIGIAILCTNCAGYLSKLVWGSFVNDIVPTLQHHLINKQTQEIILPPNYEAYIGNYAADNVPNINSLTIVKEDNKLSIYVHNLPFFFLNYTKPRTFRIVVNTAKMLCIDSYLVANVNEDVIFDDFSTRDGLYYGFILHGAHPTGKTYMHRIPSN